MYVYFILVIFLVTLILRFILDKNCNEHDCPCALDSNGVCPDNESSEEDNQFKIFVDMFKPLANQNITPGETTPELDGKKTQKMDGIFSRFLQEITSALQSK